RLRQLGPLAPAAVPGASPQVSTNGGRPRWLLGHLGVVALSSARLQVLRIVDTPSVGGLGIEGTAVHDLLFEHFEAIGVAADCDQEMTVIVPPAPVATVRR